MALGEELIGQLARRFKNDNWIGRAHRVQSVIADSVITKCGRRMHETNRDGTLQFRETWNPLSICHQCR